MLIWNHQDTTVSNFFLQTLRLDKIDVQYIRSSTQL